MGCGIGVKRHSDDCVFTWSFHAFYYKKIIVSRIFINLPEELQRRRDTASLAPCKMGRFRRTGHFRNGISSAERIGHGFSGVWIENPFAAHNEAVFVGMYVDDALGRWTLEFERVFRFHSHNAPEDFAAAMGCYPTKQL